MKAEKFEESLTNIQDKYIEETVQYQAFPEPPKKRTSVKVWRTIAIVASALVVVAIAVTAVGLLSMRAGMGTQKEAAAEAPYESFSEEDYNGGGYAGTTEPERNYAAEEPEIYEGAEVSDSEAPAENGMSAEKKTDAKSGMPQGAKIIYTANMHISTKDFPAAEEKISEIMNQYGGFFQNMEVNNSGSAYRTAYYTIRIPADKLDAFLTAVKEVGTVDSMNRSGTDVSESYYDTEARLQTAKKKLARLQELLAQAANISDIIVIEESISDVEYEIDELTGTLKNYDSDVKYSTVSIDLNEVYSLDDNDDPELSFGDRLSQGFKEGLTTFGAVFEELLIWLAESWLWILIVGAVIAAVIIIVVKSEKKSRKNKRDKK